MRRRILLGAVVGVLGIGGVILLDQLIIPALVHSRPAVRMPSVVGIALERAVESLVSQGLVVHEVRYEPSPTVPEGRVIRQVPYAGAEVRRGRRVYLTVSTGQKQVAMPALVGLSARDAQVRLLSSGLRLGRMFYEYSDSIPTGAVFWQSIPPESQVPAGTSIELGISQGPRPSIAVPSLVSLSLEEAERMLFEVGLQVGAIRLVPDPTFLPNTVVGQEPAAGVLVPPGTAISLTVAR
ncbi:MAG: PASTA domain-containing protein [Chlorobiota bacterium]